MERVQAARKHRLVFAGLLAFAGLAGCTVAAGSSPDSSTVGTVGGVGKLPGVFTAGSNAVDPGGQATISGSPTTSTTSAPGAVTTSIGQQVVGNRLLMIGDSVTASISQRYGNEACKILVPLGWQVEVNAETGRFIDFGKTVLDKRLDDNWDAAVLFLGNNYGKDKADYQSRLHALLLRLYPRPTVLLTTSMFRPEQADVNAAILEEAAQFPHVRVIDWATITQDPALTGGDNLHLTEAGRAQLAFSIAAQFGQAVVQPGKCLSTQYRSDAAGSANGPPGNSTAKKTPVKPYKPTATTAPRASATTVTSVAKPSTATTVKPSAGTTNPQPPTPSTLPPQQTTPPQQTSPPPTVAPPQQTSPPTVPKTNPPPTTPPATTPPTLAPSPSTP